MLITLKKIKNTVLNGLINARLSKAIFYTAKNKLLYNKCI